MTGEKYNSKLDLSKLTMRDKINRNLGKVIFCFTQPRTITEVSRITGVSRTTVYKIFYEYEEHFKPVNIFKYKGKKYVLSNDLVIKVIGNSIDFKKEELPCIKNLLDNNLVKAMYFSYDNIKINEANFDNPFSTMYVTLWLLALDCIEFNEFYKGKVKWKNYSVKQFKNVDLNKLIKENEVELKKLKKIITLKKFERFEADLTKAMKEIAKLWKLSPNKDKKVKLDKKLKENHPRYVFIMLHFPKSIASKILITIPQTMMYYKFIVGVDF